MKLTLKIWRQKNTSEAGRFVSYQVDGVTPDMSFLEMLDVLNEQLIERRDEPVAFEHDCREGICGSCGLPLNGGPPGPRPPPTACPPPTRLFNDRQVPPLGPGACPAAPAGRDLGG